MQLIQENQELKLVLRNRGSSLSFCGPGLLAEVAVGPRSPAIGTIKFKDVERGACGAGLCRGRSLHQFSRVAKRESLASWLCPVRC